MTQTTDLIQVREGNVKMYKEMRDRLLAELAETEDAIALWEEKLAEARTELVAENTGVQ